MAPSQELVKAVGPLEPCSAGLRPFERTDGAEGCANVAQNSSSARRLSPQQRKETEMSAHDPHHYAGQRIDTVDQTSSMHMLGLAVAGASAVIMLEWLLA